MTRVLALIAIAPLVLVSGCVLSQWSWGSASTSQPMTLLFTLAYAAQALGLVIAQATARAQSIEAYILAALVGIAVGFVGRPLILVIVWGTGGIGFLAVIAAIIGALAGISVAMRRVGADIHMIGKSVMCVGAALAVSTSAEPLRSIALDDQSLTVTFADWQPSDSELSVRGTSQVNLGRDENALLTEANLRGAITAINKATSGVGYGTHMLVVAQQPLTQPVRLSWPTHSRIAYIQDTQRTFRLVPPRARTRTDRTLLLFPDPSSPLITLYRIEGPQGMAGGVAFNWSQRPQ